MSSSSLSNDDSASRRLCMYMYVGIRSTCNVHVAKGLCTYFPSSLLKYLTSLSPYTCMSLTHKMKRDQESYMYIVAHHSRGWGLSSMNWNASLMPTFCSRSRVSRSDCIDTNQESKVHINTLTLSQCSSIAIDFYVHSFL